jgi:alkyl hydroperoxide reductase subunit AhpC
MTLRINDVAPDFEANTTQSCIRFHEFIGDSLCVLFSHPKDFTPVCTTELGYMAGLTAEFEMRNCKIIGLSVDPVADHDKWQADIKGGYRSSIATTVSRRAGFPDAANLISGFDAWMTAGLPCTIPGGARV